MATPTATAELEPRHTILAMIDSLVNGDSSAQLTTLTPSDPFLTGMDTSTTPSSTFSSAPAAGLFGADPTASSTSTDSDTTITETGTSSPTILFGTATLSSETGSGGFQSILTASETSDTSSSTSATQVLFPSLSSTFAAPSSSSTPSITSSNSNASPTQTQAPEPSAMGTSNLSGGALAAAVIVPVVAVALFAVIGVFVARRRQRQRNRQNEDMFAPETAERSSRGPPGLPSYHHSARNSNVPWPITGAGVRHEGGGGGGGGDGQEPRAHGSHPSLANSDPFGDSRAPSNASQTFGPGPPIAASTGGAQQAAKDLLAAQRPQSTVSPRPGTERSGIDDDAVSAVSDVEYQQAEVAIAHRVSVIKPRGSVSHPTGGGR